MIRGSEAWADEVIGAVSSVTGVTVAAIKGDHRGRRTVRARVACARIMLSDGRMSSRDTGEALHRDPATITYYRGKFRKIEIREIVEPARERIGGR